VVFAALDPAASFVLGTWAAGQDPSGRKDRGKQTARAIPAREDRLPHAHPDQVPTSRR
jgi:hypothetical protein